MLTKTEHSSNESQHIDLGTSRINTDYNEIVKILDWFEMHKPFQTDDARLQNIASGVCALEGKNINCDNADEIGSSIMSKMDDIVFTEAVLNRCDQVKTFSILSKKRRKDKNKTVIENNLLFNRLLVIMGRLSPNDLAQYFKHELTTVPTALFTNHELRKTNKATLSAELRKSLDASVHIDLPETYVVDGGCFLHRVIWNKTGSYLDVVK